MFKVVPDQLKISEGWVRCGKCEEIFDASAHLQEVSDPAATDPVVPDAAHASFRQELADATAMTTEPELPPKTKSDAPGAQDPAGRVEPLLEPLPGETPLLPDGSAYGVDEARPLLAEAVPEQPAAAPASTARSAELSFMRTARPPSRWHRPLMRASLLVACALLMLGLGAQVLLHERDQIAARHPGLRPLIDEACLLAGCEVRPLRQIESVVIDSSAFSKVKGDLYRLSLTLKNNAPIDLAMPAIELALTDTLDHALIRRVLLPEDLGVRDGLIRATSETQTTLLLTVKANGNGERIAGYRLLAFYP